MPRLALVLFAAWAGCLLVARSIVHWRATGSTGIKGFHGRVGSLPWLAGAAASAGLVLAPLAPVAALCAWPGGELLLQSRGAHALGAALAIVGIAGALVAQLAMGRSWRIGVDERERTALVTSGPFAFVRNPIFTFMGVSQAGFALLVPNAVGLGALALLAVGIELHVRFVEEPYLLRTHGDAYARYAASTGRFLPGIGRALAARSDDRAA